MPNYPTIAIGIITYNRFPQLLKVLDSVHTFAVYPKDKIKWVLADDGSPDNYVEKVCDLYHFDTVIVNNRGGMPVNWNSMHAACSELAEYTLALQDDFLFTIPVDLRLAVRLLEARPEYGMVRYHKLTGHIGLPMVVKEQDMSKHFPQASFGKYEYAPQMLPFVELMAPFDGSNTYSPYSGGVHLRHKRFTQMYGPYPEKTGFSSAEMEYFTRVNGRLRTDLNSASRVAMFPAFFESRFQDISPFTYRGTAIEKETMNG